jgi:hypothetical protein
MTRVEKSRMKPNSKSNHRHNALKHGAFAKELVILDENKDDFDELHNSCIKELNPSGRMEEEVVLAIAKYMWRKRDDIFNHVAPPRVGASGCHLQNQSVLS